MNQDALKKQVGIEAARHIKNDMIVGLGTGSTVAYLIDEIARRIKEEKLTITGVSTSNATSKHAKKLGIPLKTIDEVDFVDLTIDGADEISADFQGIKGGGGALLFEKIVANYSRKYIWIVDESKLVDKIGNFPLPIEVVVYGAKQIYKILENKGYHPQFRYKKNKNFFVTDNGNFIIDLHLIDPIKDPTALGGELKKMVGVIEHGLFLNMVDTVIIGTNTGIQVLNAT
ncbi:MAG: ribose-5-phosphate isomerase RpiA [Lactobacillales bacterium]|jgi:ribose 5-phosphate isomerase A|nr:ribose-5-phosphate isomerase RpiA [Lactobacillales bacterium]